MTSAWAQPRRLAAIVGALSAAVVVVVQLRSGVLQILDTASYQSGAAAFGDGKPFTTTLAPSFSTFAAADFLERDGRIPFVDFPIGFPLISGALGVVVGARRALGIVAALSTIVLVALIAWGPGRDRHHTTPWVRAVVGLGLVVAPTYRLVVQGGLSEPLFCAVLVGFALGLLRFRNGRGGLALPLLLGASLGVVRFVGTPLSALTAVEHYRRHRRLPTAIGIAAIGALPTALNVAWAGAKGGGHTAAWHGIQRLDARLFVRSVSGWFDERFGGLGETLLRVGDEVPWWGVPLVVVWAAGVGWAALSWLWPQHRHALTERAALPLLMAGMLAATLAAGLASFDALATPDNRITLPIGVLTIVGLVWWFDAGTSRASLSGLLIAVIWAGVASRPDNVTGLFSSVDPLATASQLGDVDERIVISNAADNTFWYTGKPSAYLPPDVVSLTGERVDQAAEFDRLPCALADHDGVVAVFQQAFFGVSQTQAAQLDRLVAEGQLRVEQRPSLALYRPSVGLDC